MFHNYNNVKYRPIRVVQIAGSEETFGFLQFFSEALEAEGFDVFHVAAPTGKHDHRNIKFTPLPLTRRLQPWNILKAVYLTARYLRTQRIDIVIANTFAGGIIGRVASWLAGVPVVYYWPHGWLFTPGTKYLKKKIIIAIERFFSLFHNAVICISEEEILIGRQKKILGDNSRTLQLLGIGVDVHYFTPDHFNEKQKRILRTELNLEDQDFIFIFVGRLVQEKGVFELIEAFESVKKSNGRAKLLLVGSIGSDEPDQSSIQQLEKQIAQSNAKDSIVLTGYRKDIAELLRCADVFVLPSWREGMPVSLLEAMAMELPAIATDIPGCREEILDGMTGLIVSPKDPAALGKAMVTLINDPDNSRAMGKAARCRVERFFSREIIMPLFVDSLKIVRDQLLAGETVTQFKKNDWDLSGYHWPRERTGQ